MNEWSIYIALYCVLLHTQSTIQSCGGGLSSTTTSVQHPLGWCDGCHRTTAPVRSPHTSYRWRRERVIEPIIDTGQWWEFGQSTGVTPLLFTRSAMGFLMTTECQDLGLTFHPKEGAFYSIVSPSLYWGVRIHTDHRVSTQHPAGLTNTSSNSNLVFPGGLPSRYWPDSTLLSFSGQPVLGCRVIWLPNMAFV